MNFNSIVSLIQLIRKHGRAKFNCSTHSYDQIASQRPKWRNWLDKMMMLEQVDRYNDLKQSNGVVPAIRSVLNQVDSYIENNKPSSISCKKGCSHCCYIQVSLSQDEFLNILDYIGQHNIGFYPDLVYTQSKNFDRFLNLDKKYRQCAFLDSNTGSCKIYPVRPLVCRNYMVVSDPIICSNYKRTTGVTRWQVNGAEMSTMVVWNSDTIVRGLPEFLDGLQNHH